MGWRADFHEIGSVLNAISFYEEGKIGQPPMIRKETLYQATIVNGTRDSLALLAKGCKIFVDFCSVFPMFTFIESKCVTNQYIGF